MLWLPECNPENRFDKCIHDGVVPLLDQKDHRRESSGLKVLMSRPGLHVRIGPRRTDILMVVERVVVSAPQYHRSDTSSDGNMAAGPEHMVGKCGSRIRARRHLWE